MKLEKMRSTVVTQEDVMVTVEHATPASLLAYANKVREAGNAGILDALLPSRPRVAERCLIARALNFESEISGAYNYDDSNAPVTGVETAAWGIWTMTPNFIAMPDADVHALAAKLRLRVIPVHGIPSIVLPILIGNAAFAFDNGAPCFAEFTE